MFGVSLHTLWYLLACLCIPAVWGVAMHVFVNWLQRRRAAQKRAAEPPPIDYSI